MIFLKIPPAIAIITIILLLFISITAIGFVLFCKMRFHMGPPEDLYDVESGSDFE